MATPTLFGTELLLSTVVGGQSNPPITALADGRFAVTWASVGVCSICDRLGQILDPPEVAVTLDGTAAADEYVGSLFGGTLSGSFGNDDLAGGAGQGQLFGQQGRDTLGSGTENDLLLGGSGKDTLNAGAV